MDFGGCLATALAVRPSQDVKNPFWMALIHVAGTGLKAAACKYCMCSALVVVWYALFNSKVFFLVSVFALVRGKYHKPGGSGHPRRRMFPYFLMCIVLEVNLAVHPASQNVPIEMRECRASPGSMCPVCACVGNWSSWSWNYCVACMAALLSMSTTIGGAPVLHGLCGALSGKKCPVAPVSETPVRMVVVGNRFFSRLISCPRFRLPTCTAHMSQSLSLLHIYRLVFWFVSHHHDAPVACRCM